MARRSSSSIPPKPIARAAIGAALVLILPAASMADGGVTFQDIVADGTSGITYQRAFSDSYAEFEAAMSTTIPGLTGLFELPFNPTGAPGVAVLDFDGDGDLDIYVTNGPDTPNSLFSNQLRETGSATFVDVGAASGLAATDQDSTGVCYADIDNDGDPDVLVLGNGEPNRLFENLGGGTFDDITPDSGIGGGDRSATSCAFGDVNNDGLVDVVVANTYDNWTHQLVVADPFTFSEHDQLFLNQGGNVFTDASAGSGIENLFGIPGGSGNVSWALTLADYDRDGDQDILIGTDQAALLPPAAAGGLDVGLLRLYQNDGTGQFTDISPTAGTDKWGNWMGITFGDLNCDGNIDFFSSNGGDYGGVAAGFPLGALSSRWFLGQGDGTFSDPGVGGLVGTPFGWGQGIFDYDNDTDADIIYHGGFLAIGSILATNPGAVLQNQDCTAVFDRDADALAGSTNHLLRAVYGMATGDLDENGFVDVVSVSSFNLDETAPLFPTGVVFGGPFDGENAFVPVFVPSGNPDSPSELVYFPGLELLPGDLSVELNSGGNGNRSLKVDLVGTVGITTDGASNRDGIGAIVGLTTSSGGKGLRTVEGGSSYASQNALTNYFGMGTDSRGILEVTWPGGTRNRLYHVKPGRSVTFPEIPCSFDDRELGFQGYLECVDSSLEEISDAGLINPFEGFRFFLSAILAYFHS